MRQRAFGCVLHVNKVSQTIYIIMDVSEAMRYGCLWPKENVSNWRDEEDWGNYVSLNEGTDNARHDITGPGNEGYKYARFVKIGVYPA